MYRQLNRSKPDNDTEHADESMSEEIRAEDNASAMGNESLIAENLIAGISNEANSQALSERIENFDQIPEDDLVPSPGADDNLTITTLKNASRKKANSPKKNGPPKAAQKRKKPDKDLAGIEEFTDIVGEEDIAHTDEDMSPVKGLDFAVQNLPVRKNKPGKMRKFASWLAYYGGKTAGALLGLLGNLVVSPFTLGRWIQRTYRRGKNKKEAPERDRNAIPGWNGRNFEETVKNDKELGIDFRRVPAVWSYPIAEKAVDSNGKERPPVISVYVKQPDENRDQTMDDQGNTGHTGIGIEYSRYSKVSGEWERYNLRYGFYPAGGLRSKSAMGVMGYEKAVIPGQLMNEKGSTYTISRSYPATNKQVNTILDASVPYADKGYNNYTRNCTSFAKAMLLDVAHIPGGKEIFARDEIRLNAKNNAQIFGASMAVFNLETSMEGDLNKLITGEDMSYMNYGGKRMSAEEYKNYSNSLSYFKRRPKKADSPNAVAENIRRLEGNNVGTVGKFGHTLQPDLMRARDMLRVGGKQIKQILEELTPEGAVDKGSLPEEFSKITDMLDDLGQPIDSITIWRKAEEFSREDIKTMRSGLSENIILLNKLLYKYYKNDKRLHLPVLNMISYLNEAINELDSAYETVTDNSLLGEDDLGSLRQELTRYGYKITAGGKQAAMTPSLYEAYIQMYKTPKEAVKNYARFIELKEKRDNGGRLQGPEVKEFEKLARVRSVAGDFDRSHRYMLEKESFSQQDIDYAFELQNKEHNDAQSRDLSEEHLYASDIYQSLFLEKVFSGLKARFTLEAEEEGRNSRSQLRTWLDEDMAQSVKNRTAEMTNIARGAVKNVAHPSHDNLKGELWVLIRNNWINRLFPDKDDKLRKTLLDVWSQMTYYGKLGKALDPIVKQIISELPKEIVHEDEDDEDD